MNENSHGTNVVVIKPSKFYEAFLAIVDADAAMLSEKWSWKYTKEFTQLMLSNERSTIQKVANLLGLKCYREYWSIDAVYYSDKHCQEYFQDRTYAKKVHVAIEHENMASRAHEEVNKLTLIDSPLSVVVTYPDEGSDEKLLAEYSEIVASADSFGDFCSTREKMVIFGSLIDGRPDWSCYRFNGQKFVSLNDSHTQMRQNI